MLAALRLAVGRLDGAAVVLFFAAVVRVLDLTVVDAVGVAAALRLRGAAAVFLLAAGFFLTGAFFGVVVAVAVRAAALRGAVFFGAAFFALRSADARAIMVRRLGVLAASTAGS